MTAHPLLGAHVSIAGGTAKAPGRAKAIGARAMQIFTKMANRWAERDCDDVECSEFHAEMAGAELSATNAHDSYLINLASPDETLRARSIASFAAELRRCRSLGLHALVSHPGNFMDERDAGLKRNAEGITEALELVDGGAVLLMETTAGQGTVIGATFEELAALIDLVPASQRHRIGVCLDTAHVFAAGYDLVHDYDGVIARFDDTIGLERLKLLHLNDSKAPFNSKKDRHELIGEGAIGEGAFQRIMNDSRLALVPKVLETPKLDDAEATDRRMIARLLGYVAAGTAGA